MPTHDKVNILMVDDQPAKLLSYEAILGELGDNLIKASSGREALEVLLKTDVAVVLMDVSMPEMDGFEMAEIIRQHPRFQKTAIIFISGVHLTDLDRLKGYERGAVDYISVPVVPAVLRAKVSVFAELHRKTRQLEILNRELEERVNERTEELRENEALFRMLSNSIPQLAWMANADGTVFWYNQRWYEYTGSTPEEAQADAWQKVHHPEHVDRVLKSIQHSWHTGEPWEDTCPLRGHDGRYRWFLSRSVPMHDSHGKIVRWFGTSTDISDQIAAEQKIRQLNTDLKQRIIELETIMQVLPVGVAVAQDPQCHVVSGNAALSEMLGMNRNDNLTLTPATPTRMPFGVYKNGALLPLESFPLQQAARTGLRVGNSELEVRRDDGKAMQILMTANPFFDEDGSVRGAVGALFDVTERKQMEDTLRERADLLDLASEAVMVRDSSGILQFWNVGAETLYGWKRDEVIGKNVHEILQTAYPVTSREIDSRLISTGRWDGNLIQYTKDGREITVASRQAIKDGTTNEGGSILEINRDISSQLQAEDALRKTERLAAMGRVAGIIAHEINNPLEAITNAFFLLRDHPSLDDEARHYARMAEEELLRVAHITRQTLSFYRESTQAVEVSIATVIEDVLELQTRRLKLNNIVVEKDYYSDGAILGFPAELKQVFLNLIGNAVQAMPEGGRLKVRVIESTSPNDRRKGVRVSILDNGTGIRPDDAKRLFEPFFTTKSAKGTGLGLWISKGIVQKYDGNIRCRSLRVNGGYATCFSVFLPGTAAAKSADKGKAQEAIGSR